MFSTVGALAGLALAVILIFRKAPPAYALALGALAGGLAGGGGLQGTVAAMMSGAQSMMPSVLRILASGILVGALVKTGSAAKIADSVIGVLGARFAVAAVAISAMIVTASGVFVDIAVITVAPIALAVGRKAGIPVSALLVAMVGGGKAGNVISPNPNTIAVAESFNLDLVSVMVANVVPALCALAVAIAISTRLSRRRSELASSTVAAPDAAEASAELPAFWKAALGPVAVVALLALRPICGVVIDPMAALPAGGIVSILACGRWRETAGCAEFGLSKVAGVAILLVGTGTIAGIVKGSGLNGDMIAMLGACHMPVWALAPVSGVLLSGVTASTTAGVTIASQTFSGALFEAGVPAIAAAATLHAGGTIFDALPHGSFFHATAGAVGMSTKERLRLFPYGTLVGATTTVVSVIVNMAMR